jgi:hypothetical protein
VQPNTEYFINVRAVCADGKETCYGALKQVLARPNPTQGSSGSQFTDEEVEIENLTDPHFGDRNLSQKLDHYALEWEGDWTSATYEVERGESMAIEFSTPLRPGYLGQISALALPSFGEPVSYLQVISTEPGGFIPVENQCWSLSKVGNITVSVNDFARPGTGSDVAVSSATTCVLSPNQTYYLNVRPMTGLYEIKDDQIRPNISEMQWQDDSCPVDSKCAFGILHYGRVYNNIPWDSVIPQ